MQTKGPQPAQQKAASPIHVIATEPRLPRADALRTLHAGLAKAEENLYSLVHAKRPHGGAPLRRRPPPFILTTPDLVITEEPFDLKALTEQPGGTSTRPAWGKWSYSGDDGVRAE